MYLCDGGIQCGPWQSNNILSSKDFRLTSKGLEVGWIPLSVCLALPAIQQLVACACLGAPSADLRVPPWMEAGRSMLGRLDMLNPR
jgi:hypothetical protein